MAVLTRTATVETRYVVGRGALTEATVEAAMVEAKAYRNNGTRRRATLHAPYAMAGDARWVARAKELGLKLHEATQLEGWALEVIPHADPAPDLDLLLVNAE